MGSATIRIDETLLLKEIKKRPSLYDNKMKGYADAMVRKRHWVAVYTACVHNWKKMSMAEKSDAIKETQKRWQTLRIDFAKDLKAEREAKAEEMIAKNRAYYNFDRMQFLSSRAANRKLPHTSDHVMTHAVKEEPCNHANSSSLCIQNTETISNTHELKKTVYEEIIRIIKERETCKTETLDEDTHFVMSLVPYLKKIPVENKLETKIKILSFLQLKTKVRDRLSLAEKTDMEN